MIWFEHVRRQIRQIGYNSLHKALCIGVEFPLTVMVSMKSQRILSCAYLRRDMEITPVRSPSIVSFPLHSDPVAP